MNGAYIPAESTSVLRATIQELETKLDAASKDKGQALNELAETKSKLDSCQKQKTAKLTLSDVIASIIEGIRKFQWTK